MAHNDRVPALKERHPPGCPDADWCAGNRMCFWHCVPSDADLQAEIDQIRREEASRAA